MSELTETQKTVQFMAYRYAHHLLSEFGIPTPDSQPVAAVDPASVELQAAIEALRVVPVSSRNLQRARNTAIDGLNRAIESERKLQQQEREQRQEFSDNVLNSIPQDRHRQMRQAAGEWAAKRGLFLRDNQMVVRMDCDPDTAEMFLESALRDIAQESNVSRDAFGLEEGQDRGEFSISFPGSYSPILPQFIDRLATAKKDGIGVEAHGKDGLDLIGLIESGDRLPFHKPNTEATLFKPAFPMARGKLEFAVDGRLVASQFASRKAQLDGAHNFIKNNMHLEPEMKDYLTMAGNNFSRQAKTRAELGI